MQIKHALLPTDFSAGSEAALGYALEMGSRLKFDLHLVHVIDRAILAPYGPNIVPDTYTFYQQVREFATAELEKIQKQLSKSVTVTTSIIDNGRSVVDNIREEAVKHSSDLIIMATHGRQGINRMVMGSVAENVVRVAPCPVLLVKPKVRAE